MFTKLADSSLSPAEKEERQVERLINKKPAPSRKPAERTGPKHDNRRERIEIDDPDMGSSDKDMSLNRKGSSTRLADIALRIVLAAPKDERPKKKPGSAPKPKEKAKPEPKKDVGPKAPSKNKPESNKAGLNQAVSRYEKTLRSLAPSVADSFKKYAADNWLEPLEWEDDKTAETESAEHWHEIQELEKKTESQSKRLLTKILNLDAEKLPEFVSSVWPNDSETDWSSRASVINAVMTKIKKNKLPASFKAPFLREGAKSNDKELIKAIVDDVGGDFSVQHVLEGEAATFGALAAMYQAVIKNPLRIDATKLTSQVENIRRIVDQQVSDLLTAMTFMEEWEKSVDSFHNGQHSVKNVDSYKPETDSFSKALKDVDSFFSSKKPIVDPKKLMGDFQKKLTQKYGKIPKALLPAFGRAKAASGATSNDAVVKKVMTQKSASYHGVIKQGHPSGDTNTGYTSYDKRYFGKEHFASIISAAKEYLSQDWLQHGWEGSISDAQIRAALDLAIHTADSNLYQSKIDAETYDMLLNRLAGWDHDSFSETVHPIPAKSKRSASDMKTHYQNIVRIANDLRNTDPKRALSILTNLRALVAQEQECDDMPSTASPAAPPPPAPGPAAPPSVAQADQNKPQEMAPEAPPAPVAQISDADTDAFVEGHLDIKDLKSKTQKLVDAKDMDDFVAGLKDLHDLMKKTASGRIANDLPELAPLEDMSDEEVQAFLKNQNAKGQDMLKALSDDDIEAFMQHFDDLTSGAEEAAKQVKTGSVRVKLGTLVRLAMNNSEAAKVLMPVLVAAKKKMDKKKKKPAQTSQKKKDDDKKDAKTSQEKENPFAKKDGKKDDKKGDKKAPPFGGKKAPPFGKKGDKKTSQKRKATIEISDTEW